jgi:hypothetical protein
LWELELVALMLLRMLLVEVVAEVLTMFEYLLELAG